MAGKAHTSLNVFKKPLYPFSKDPPTGFYRTGKCDVGPDDDGNHSIAATLTSNFLDFTASQGNDLRRAGLQPGQKWCLCAHRWREAMVAAQRGAGDVVPKVHLHATHERALDVVELDVLKRYAAEQEVGNASTVAQSREGGAAGAVRERTELARKDDMTSRDL